MPATLHSLSPEIIDLIVLQLFVLDVNDPLGPYATISRPFQVAVERFTFTRVYVSGDHQKRLRAISAHPWRKTALRTLIYAVTLPPYPSFRRYLKERRREHRANLVAFHKGLTTLWKELATWNDKTHLVDLQVGAESPTDEYDDDGWHEGCEDYRWLYPDHSLSIDSQKAALPTVDCVNSFLVGGGRRIHPTAFKEMFLTMPNLRELNLTLPPVHARYKASRAEYRADLGKALEASTLQKLEVLCLSLRDSAPENHDFNIALAEDPSYPGGDVLSHAIRKLAQRSLRILHMDGPCIVSPALWSSGREDDDAEFPHLTEMAVDMTIVTYDGRWYYTGDPAAVIAQELDSEEELLIGVEDESESEKSDDSRYDEEIDEERAAFFNGNIPYHPWRRNPDPNMFDPLVRSLAEAALRMPQLQYLNVSTKGSRGYKRYRDVDIDLCSPGCFPPVMKELQDTAHSVKDWRWIIDLGLEVSWTLPVDVQQTMKKRVGEDGRVLIHRDTKVVHQI